MSRFNRQNLYVSPKEGLHLFFKWSSRKVTARRNPRSISSQQVTSPKFITTATRQATHMSRPPRIPMRLRVPLPMLRTGTRALQALRRWTQRDPWTSGRSDRRRCLPLRDNHRLNRSNFVPHPGARRLRMKHISHLLSLPSRLLHNGIRCTLVT